MLYTPDTVFLTSLLLQITPVRLVPKVIFGGILGARLLKRPDVPSIAQTVPKHSGTSKVYLQLHFKQHVVTH